VLGAAILSVLLLGDGADDAFLLERAAVLRAQYDEHARQQSAASVRVRLAVVREVAHLPFRDDSRRKAGGLLGRIVTEDRSYRVRADAARAIGRVGTDAALAAMYRALFGEEGRSRRYELMYQVLPEALASLRHPDDVDWIDRTVLEPALAGKPGPVLRQAGPLQTRLVALTLLGVGRAKLLALARRVRAFAGQAGADPEVRIAAVRALGLLGLSDPAIPLALRDPDVAVRDAAAGIPVLDEEQVKRALADPAARVRRTALRALAARPPRFAVPLLVPRLANEPLSALRLDAAESLHRLTGKEFGADHDLWRSWWSANADTFDTPGQRERAERPYFFDVGLRTDRVIFVIDVSSSMRAEDERGVSRLERAASELAAAAVRLPANARFEVLAFAGEIRRFPDDMGGADRREGAAAAAWLNGLRPAGATNTYGAILTALQSPFAPDSIVLLSDGNPYRCSYQGRTYSEHEQILAEVEAANRARAVRIHTVALLSGAPSADSDEDAESAADFLRRLATANDGEFREIR